MITKEKLGEASNLIKDLQMISDFRENMNKDEPFIILPLTTPMSIVFDQPTKEKINSKISEVETQLKTKLTELIATEESQSV